jgi:ABC-type ATPase involved in cell division
MESFRRINRLAIAKALLDTPRLVLVDASRYALDDASLQWLVNLPTTVPRLVAMSTLPLHEPRGIQLIKADAIEIGETA